MAPTQQRVPTTLCAKCRKAFIPGDRVELIYIVSKVGRNMESKDMGAWLCDDFELGHVSCADTGLDGRIIPGING